MSGTRLLPCAFSRSRWVATAFSVRNPIWAKVAICAIVVLDFSGIGRVVDTLWTTNV